MRKLVFVLFATACFATPSFAQQQGGGGSSAGGKGGVMKEAVQGCRKQAMAQGLTPGKEMRQAVMDCVVKDHPGMANMMKCRMTAMDNGMKPGSDDLKSYVKDCVKKARGA